MLTASNKKHARLKWIFISSRIAWVFSKSKVLLWEFLWAKIKEEYKTRCKESERKDRSTVRDTVPLAVTSRSPRRTHSHALPLYPACLITLTTLPIWYTPPTVIVSPIPSSFLFLFFNHKVTRKVSPVRQAFSFNDTEKGGEALGSPAGEQGVSTCACILPCPSVCRWSKWLDPVSGLINERHVGSRTSYQSRH